MQTGGALTRHAAAHEILCNSSSQRSEDCLATKLLCRDSIRVPISKYFVEQRARHRAKSMARHLVAGTPQSLQCTVDCLLGHRPIGTLQTGKETLQLRTR